MGKIYKVFVTETLRKEVEVEAFSEKESLELVEKAYNEGEIVLCYDELIDTEFSNCKLSKKEIEIHNLIKEYCDKKCLKKCSRDCIIEKIKNVLRHKNVF